MPHPRYELLSEEDVIKVHAYANFGHQSPRNVVDEGVLKTALGYHHGSTARAILLEHGLMRETGDRARPGLTAAGARYLNVLFPRQAVERLADLSDCPEGHPDRSLFVAFFGHDPGQEEQRRLWRAGLLRNPAQHTTRPAPTATARLKIREALSHVRMGAIVSLAQTMEEAAMRAREADAEPSP